MRSCIHGCKQGNQSVLSFDSVPLGSSGPWALNLWFQTNSSVDSVWGGVEYLFSQQSLATQGDSSPLNPNQVAGRCCL